MSLTFNSVTKKLLLQIEQNLPHALLLEGVIGVGLLTTAKHLAGTNLASIVEATDIDGATDKQKGIIRAPQIRQLYQATRGKSTTKRIFIIDEADKMNHVAQNALLKLLEEPVTNVHFILTSHNPNNLLPTILSRVQRLNIQQTTSEQSKKFIEQLGVTNEQKVRQLIFLAGGRPAELARLANNQGELEKQSAYIGDARIFLQGSMYDKVVIASRYHADRPGALLLLKHAQTIILYTLSKQPTRELVLLADAIANAYDRVAANGNVRVQLLAVVI